MHRAHQRRRAVGFGLVRIDAERQEILDGRSVAEPHGFREGGGLIVTKVVGSRGGRLAGARRQSGERSHCPS
jgi:hypothetical protein